MNESDRSVDASAGLRADVVGFLTAGALISSIWIGSGVIGLSPFIILALFVIVAGHLPDGRADRPASPEAADRRRTGLVSALILMPSALYLALTWNQEFPFVGDHDYHLVQSDIAYSLWRIYFIPVSALLLIVWRLAAKRYVSWLAGGLLLCFAAIGLGIHGSLFFAARYPGSFYFVAVPVKALARAFDWDSPLNALRLTNFLSLPVWLFALRPAILRRWPDVSILPAAAFLFWQKDFVYYFTSSYLEPWAIVFVLVAVEHLIVFGKERVWRVWLLVGMAALFKEQAILVLPFVVLAGFPYRGTRERKAVHAVAAFASGLPFLIYYLFRRSLSIWRTAGLLPVAELVDPARLEIMAQRAWLEFGWSIVVVGSVIAIGLYLSFARRASRAVFSALTAAGIFQVVFFYADRISQPWTGYSRFNLMAVALFSGSLMWLGHHFARRKTILIASAIALISISSLLPFILQTRVPDYRRNFIEHRDAPAFFPVQDLMRAAKNAGALRGVRGIRVLSTIPLLVPNYDMRSFAAGYPGIGSQLRIAIAPLAARGPDQCICRASEANLALYPFITNLGRELPEIHRALQVADACNQTLRKTCATVFRVDADGQQVGALGVGVRSGR